MQEFIIVRNEKLLLDLKICIELGLVNKVETIKVIENKQEFIIRNKDLFTEIGTFKRNVKFH